MVFQLVCAPHLTHCSPCFPPLATAAPYMTPVSSTPGPRSICNRPRPLVPLRPFLR